MKRTLSLLRELIAPVRLQIVLLLCLTGVLSLSAAVPAFFMRSIIDNAIGRHDPHALAIAVFAMLANAVTFAALGYGQGILNVRISQRVTRTLRVRMADRIYRVPLAALSDATLGGLITRISNDVDGLDGLWSGTLVMAISNATQVAIGLVLVFGFSRQLGLVALIVIPALTLPLTRIGRSIYRARMESRAVRDRFNTVLAETLSVPGISFIKSHVLYEPELARIEALNRAQQSSELRATEYGLRFSLVNTFTTMATPAIIWFVGYGLVMSGSVTLGALLAIITLLLRLFTPATSLATLQVSLTGSSALVDRLREYLDLPRETEGAVPRAAGDPAVPRGAAVRFDAVSLRFGEGPYILRDVTFDVAPGEVVALCGASGVGKTSLARLLIRLIDPTSGTIRLDGADVSRADVHELRRRVAIVQQEPFLLNDTVAANVALGSGGASPAEIAEACRLACAADFVEALPNRYDTVIGDRGMRLSGGQRQRIALARLFLRRPSVVVLDEATSALDVDTERAVLANVNDRFAPCARILITHRESTLALVDRAVYVHEGRIAHHPYLVA